MDGWAALIQGSGFAGLGWQNLVMFVVAGVLVYLAVTRNYEPLLLVPIGFGAVLANLPFADLSASSTYVGLNQTRGGFPMTFSYGLTSEAWGGFDSGVYGLSHGSYGSGVIGYSDNIWGYGGKFSNSDSDGVALMAGGSGIIKSTADTTIAVSPLNMVEMGIEWEPFVGIDYQLGYVVVQAMESAGWYQLVVPVDVPSVLFGTPVELKSATVCYRCSRTSDRIRSTRIGSTSERIYRHSTSPACYTLEPDAPEEIDEDLYLFITVEIQANDSNSWVEFDSFQVTLTE